MEHDSQVGKKGWGDRSEGDGEGKERYLLPEVGITGGLTIKASQTGDKLLLVPGPDSGTKADAVAARLRKAVAGLAEVGRPEKMTGLRVSGLEDTATISDVIKELADKGGCPTNMVTASELRDSWAGPRGYGTHGGAVPNRHRKEGDVRRRAQSGLVRRIDNSSFWLYFLIKGNQSFSLFDRAEHSIRATGGAAAASPSQ
ncbi:unnamed protein product [Chilo suppressalis]|uniref:Uncharacterized protein n=1 Tax=Chilo suppressalis TaxID=168631 RepID=A0ABN8BB14_CHISP|nr:unnamed protein product [Chilo suppressalis]